MKYNYSIIKNVPSIANPVQFRNLFAGIILLLFGQVMMGQVTTVNLLPASANPWTVPVGVTSISIQAWGGGGSGGASNVNSDGGSGGGAGAYTTLNNINVSALPNIPFTVGVGGTAAQVETAASGGNTSILGLVANGGAGGTRNGGLGAGGGTASGGSTNTTGGNGGAGGGNTGGNGGASPNGGTGGNGQSNGNGNSGNSPGGGGGGGEHVLFSGPRIGGNGGNGQIKITYIRPTITSLSTNNGCPGSNVNINGTNLSAVTSVSFNGTNATIVSSNATQIVATVPASASSGPILVTVATGFASSTTFTVNPLPVVNPITGSTPICPGTSVTLSNTTPGGVWSSLNPTIATVNAGGVVTGVANANGTATITYSVTVTGCMTTVSTTVLVNPTPALSGPTTVCVGSQIQLFPNSGGIWSGGNASASISSSGLVTGLSFGPTTFTYTDSATGCTSTASITVNDPPAITLEPLLPQIICYGDTANITISATGGNLLYQWYNGATLLNALTLNVSGWNTPTLTISPASVTDSSANYHCVVSNSCAASADTSNLSLIVNQKPVIPNQTTSVCSGLPFAVEPIDGVPTAATEVPVSTTYLWPTPIMSAGITGGTADSGQMVISQTLTNSGTASGTATYTVTPISGTSGNCIGNTFTVVVTVNPVPYILNLSPGTCSGETFSITPATSGGNLVPPGTTYSWSAPVVTGGMTGGSAQINQATINQTLINPTNTVHTASYNITATAGSCVGSTFSMVITVNPQPTVGADVPSQTICSGDNITAINLNNPNSVPGTSSYSWVRDNTTVITGIPNASGDIIAGILTNTTNVTQTTTFTINATSEEGCPSLPATVTVTVEPRPVISATPMSQIICSGATASISLGTSNSVAGTTFTWTRDNLVDLTGLAASGSGNIFGVLVNNTGIQQITTFTITASANGCPTTINTVSVAVNPVPTVAATTSTPSICTGSSFDINVTNPNNVPGTVFTWSKDNPLVIASSVTLVGNTLSGVLTHTNAADQVVQFTLNASIAGCPPTSTQVQISVNATPTLIISPPTQPTICDGWAFTTINFSSNIPGTTYSWTRDNTTNLTGIPTGDTTSSISGTLTNITGVSQTTIFTVTATAPNNCSKTSTVSVTVAPPMTGTLTISANQAVCSGETPAALFISAGPTGGTSILTYQWQRSTVSNTGPWTNIGTNSPTYPPPATNGTTPDTFYQLIINGCQSFTSNAITIEVENGLNNTFSLTDGIAAAGNIVCPGTSFTPYINSNYSFLSYSLYSWNVNGSYFSPATGGPVGTQHGGGFLGLEVRTDFNIGPIITANNTNASVTVAFTISPSVYFRFGGGALCTLSPESFNVTIRPKPVAFATRNGSDICNGSSAGIVVSGNITDSSMNFSWTRSVNGNVTSSQASGNSGILAAGGTFTIPDLLTSSSAVLEQVTYTITPFSPSCTGAPISVTIFINPFLPGTISSDQVICNGDDAAAFTETTAPIGGTSYTYQWQRSTVSATGPYSNITVNGTSQTYDVAAGLAQTTWYVRVVTSIINGQSCSITTTTPVKITVNTIAPGSISGNQTICAGGDPTLLTSGTLGSGAGVIGYQWQSNTTGCGGLWTDITGATGSSYDPPSGLSVTTYYRRKATSNIAATLCPDYSNCITVTINDVTGGTVAADQLLCNSTNPAAFTQITPSTGSGVLTYQWQSGTGGCSGSFTNISGAFSPTYDAPSGLTVTTYYRRMTVSTLTGVSCNAFSNCITVTPSSVTGGVIDGNRTVCLGGDPAAFTSVVPGTAASLQYQWQSSTTGLPGSWSDILLATAATCDIPGPVTQVMYYQRVTTDTSTGCLAASNFLTVFVNNITTSVVAGDQSVCASDPAAFTQVSPASGYGTLSYQWQRSSVGCSGPWTNITGAISNVYDPPVLTDTTYYHLVVTSTINGSTCTAETNCITVMSFGKTWTGVVSADWYNDNNWSPIGVPTSSHCVVIPNVFTDPVIAGVNSDAYAQNITVLNGGRIDIQASSTLNVTDVVNVNASGQFLILDDASLVQVNNVANIGIINMQRITEPMYRFDFTYWGSPMTMASNFRLGGVGGLSPQTLSDKYFSWTPTISNSFGGWFYESAATVMNPSKGYIVRAPQSFSFTPDVKVRYTANFIGTPNNGDVFCPIYHGTLGPANNNDKYNLLGNPYPSAVDAEEFLSDAVNELVIDGTIYFWTHSSPPSGLFADPFYGDYVLNYNAADYASWNKVGGTGTTLAATTGGATPSGFIAAGQGFFTKSTGNAPSGNSVVFRNSMRTSANNGQFFRTANTSQSLEKHRVWLNLVNNTNGGLNQILIGYIEGATTNWDRDFDGVRISETGMTLYSIIPDNNLVIQGRPLPFNVDDQVALGLKIPAPGNYSIRIDHLDGLFENQNIYLEDKLLNIVHDLKMNPYTFAAAAGTFNDRFIIRYNDAALGVTNPDTISGLIALIDHEKLLIQSSSSIRRIYVYDISGKLIKSYIPEESKKDFKGDFVFAEGIYMVKIKLMDGSVITQKLINKSNN